MSLYRLPPDAGVGMVTLAVQNIEKLSDFYQRIIGLRIRSETGNAVELGTDDLSLIRLEHAPEGIPAIGTTGLFHLAILVPNRPALAHWLRHAIASGYQLDGAADHLVSEALYLSDPEGNGIEVYCDRPRENWQYHEGNLLMDTLALNLPELLSVAPETPFQKLPDKTKMGHIHLKVNNLDKGLHFFEETLAFDKVALMPGAGFLGAGGYHHHIGINTWHSRNAPPPAENRLGLKSYTILLPQETEIKQLMSHLEANQIRLFTDSSERPAFKDPFSNTVRADYRISIKE